MKYLQMGSVGITSSLAVPLGGIGIPASDGRFSWAELGGNYSSGK